MTSMRSCVLYENADRALERAILRHVILSFIFTVYICRFPCLPLGTRTELHYHGLNLVASQQAVDSLKPVQTSLFEHRGDN